MSGAVPSTFRDRLQAGETVIGSFVNLGSPLAAEIMGIAGFDWLVLDLEHGAGDEAALSASCRRSRPPAPRRSCASRGSTCRASCTRSTPAPTGVLVPRLRAVEDARRCVEYCALRGPPRRGALQPVLALGPRGSRWLEDVDAEIVCAVQIETA